jgi:kynureninase
VTRDEALALDAVDPLAVHRAAFTLPEGVIYLDGNSLGALPRATAARLREVVEREWGDGLIRSWNSANWIDLPHRVGAKIARLIGARPEQVICADSTSVNLFKVLSTALHLVRTRPQVSTHARRVFLTERSNFPTDLYIAQGLTDLLDHAFVLKRVEFDEVPAAITDCGNELAVVMLTHVNYRTGAMHDMAAITAAAHAAGALTIWDLSHSAGAVPLELDRCEVDFAVGCGYKYLNGGPGAPAYLYVAGRHLEAVATLRHAQPLAGWFGHRAPFDFAGDYEPASSIDCYAVGTPSILALAALDIGVDTVLAAGVEALHAKSIALTELFMRQVHDGCGDALARVSPHAAGQRGSQVCLAHDNAYPIVQALIARGVIGDFRAPDILRFGFAPLYVRHVDAWDAAAALADVVRSGAWRAPDFQRRATVT